MKNLIPWWMRIRMHLLLFGVTMSIFPLFVLSFLSFNTVHQYLQKSILEQNFERVKILADETQEVFKKMDSTFSYVAASNAFILVGDDIATRKIVLGQLLDQEIYFDEIKVTDKNWKVLDQVYREDTLVDSIPTQLENTISLKQAISINNEVFLENKDSDLYLTVAIPDPLTKDEIGYLQAKIDLGMILDKLREQWFGQVGQIYLIDEVGNLISHTDFDRVLDQKNFRENPAVQSFLQGDRFSSGSEYKNLEGINVIGWFAPIDSLNWGVLFEQSAGDVYKPIYNFALKLLIIALLIMAIAVILSITFALKFVQPVESLEEKVREIIATGDLQAHIPIESWDEIGRLVQSFNQLLCLLEQTNENLKDEKELLRIVVDGIGAGMVLLNPEKKIVWWNTIFADWFGNNLEDLPCDFSLENGRVISVDVNSERRHIRQMYYELVADKSKDAAYLILLEDVTRQIEMETRMIENDKMAAIGLLSSGVAHEINNPLAIVAAHSEDILDRLKEEKQDLERREIEASLKIVLEQTYRCKQITARLLGLARKSTDNDFVDVGAVTVQVLGLLGNRAKQKNIKIDSQIDTNLFIFGNESEWQQVMLNILTNALDASYEGGLIEIKAWYDQQEIHFTIKDYGCGIPENYKKKVFVPFFTTKPVGQGTGLGLFISYGIVQKLQGKLFIDSIEGKGTTINITLPSYEAGVC